MTHTLGCDTNHWEGVVYSNIMKDSGIKFNIPKFTDFSDATKKGFQDNQYDNTYQGHKANGIPISGYHWLKPNYDPTVQSNYFLERYFKYEFDFAPMLDFEDRNYSSTSDYLWRAQVWLENVEKATGKIPIFYSGLGFMYNFPKEKTGFLKKYPLCLAQYTVLQAPPRVPYPWDNWTFWQFTDAGDGKKYGISGAAIDLDYFNGSLDEFYSFCGGKWAVKPTLYRRVMKYASGKLLKIIR